MVPSQVGVYGEENPEKPLAANFGPSLLPTQSVAYVFRSHRLQSDPLDNRSQSEPFQLIISDYCRRRRRFDQN